MESLQTVAAVPHLVGLELLETPLAVTTADLLQLLQHPNSARLKFLRLDAKASKLLAVDAMRLVARLPQLRTFHVIVPQEADGAVLLQPLTDAPALTDLTVREFGVEVDAALLAAIGGCARLRRLSLHRLAISSNLSIALFSAPSLRGLLHLELADCIVSDYWAWAAEIPQEDQYRTAFSALEQLQSVALDGVSGTDRLLPHLHRVPSLRLLSIRCTSRSYRVISTSLSALPSRAVLSALLTAAPQLEARLLLPATLRRWLALDLTGVTEYRRTCEQQWGELQRMGAELERVTIVDVGEESD